MENKFSATVSTHNSKIHENSNAPCCSCEREFLKSNTSTSAIEKVSDCSSEISGTCKWGIHQACLSSTRKSLSHPWNNECINSQHTITEPYNEKLSRPPTEGERTRLAWADKLPGTPTDVFPSQPPMNLERRQFRLEDNISENGSNFLTRYSTTRGQYEVEKTSSEAGALHQVQSAVKECCDVNHGNGTANSEFSVLPNSRRYLEFPKENQKGKFTSRIPRAGIIYVRKTDIPSYFPPTIHCQEESDDDNEVFHEALSKLSSMKPFENRHGHSITPENSTSSRKWKSNPEFPFSDLYEALLEGDSRVDETSPSNVEELWQHNNNATGIPEGRNCMTQNPLSTANNEETRLDWLAGNSPEALQPKSEKLQCGENSLTYSASSSSSKCVAPNEWAGNDVTVYQMKIKNIKQQDCGKVNSSPSESFVALLCPLLMGDNQDVSKDGIGQCSYEDAEGGTESTSYKIKVQRKLADLKRMISELTVFTENAKDNATSAEEDDTGKVNGNNANSGSSTTNGPPSSCSNAAASRSNYQQVFWQTKHNGESRRRIVPRVHVQCRRKTLIDLLLTPAFIRQFQAHAMHQNNLKSGLVMTKHRSCKWLKRAGLFKGIVNKDFANKAFTSDAGLKIVMNIQTYIQYLRKISLASRIKPQDLVEMLSQCPPPMRKVNLKKQSPKFRKDISFEERLSLLMSRPLRSTCSVPSFLLK